MAKTGNYKIPFDSDGNQLDWQGYGVEMRDNHEFEDTLTLDSYGRGRSSVTFSMRRSDGKKVVVFVSDFFDMAQAMVRGQLAGRFTFTKRGQNYGCRLVEVK